MNINSSTAVVNELVSPYVAKNKATRYESWMIITASGLTTYVQTHQFSLAATASTLTPTQTCGNVVNLSFNPGVSYSISTTGKKFYLEYTTTVVTEAATGVASGGNYPAYKKSGTFNLMTTSTGGLISSDISSLTASTAIEMYVAMPDGAISTVEYYYIDDSERSTVKFIITSETTSRSVTAPAPVSSAITTPQVVPVSSSATNVTTDSVTLASTAEIVTQLPPGFAFTSTTIVGSTDTSLAGNAIYDSSNMYFKFPALVTAVGSGNYASQTLRVSARAYWATAVTDNTGLFIYG
jgi:hypothetical protein